MGPPSHPDAVVRAAARGDSLALETLVRRHYQAVWRTLVRFTGDRDAADALCQEAFLRAIEGLSGYRGEAAFPTWVTRIGLNLALNDSRRRPARALDRAVDPASRGAGPSEAVERDERTRIVRDAVDRLPDDLRGAVLLTSFAGLTQREAAEHLGCPEGTVAWRVFEGRRRLKEALPHGL